MRFFITLSLAVFSGLCSPAWAQQALTKTQVEEFYQECMEYPHPLKDNFSKRYFCSCASNNYYKSFNQRDAASLKFPRTDRGEFAHKQLILQVYSPCMDDAVTDFMYYECTGTSYLDKVDNFSKATYCACQRYRIPMLLKEKSRILRSELRTTEGVIEDPLTSYLTNEYFVRNTAEVSQICFDYAKKEPEKPLISVPPRNTSTTAPGKRPVTAPLVASPQSSPHGGRPYGGE